MTKSFFLDTNILFNYADNNRRWHEATHTFYNDRENDKYSGIRVKEEAKKVIRRLNNFLINMTIHISSGKDIISFFNENIKNNNDKRYFKQLMKQNNEVTDDDILKQFRTRNTLLEVGVKEALLKIDNPLINKIANQALEFPLRGNIDNISDVKIMVDVVSWCLDNRFLCFLTCDFTDFIHNRDDICGCICRVHMLDKVDLPLEIKHIGEI